MFHMILTAHNAVLLYVHGVNIVKSYIIATSIGYLLINIMSDTYLYISSFKNAT